MIWNGILYLVKTGCQWRMLPKDSPKWQLVYYYYKIWADLGQLEFLLEHLRGKVRVKIGQKSVLSLGIIDSQSIHWGNNRSLKGFDGNKKIKGIKRHVGVDKNGFLIGIMLNIANMYDSKAVVSLMRVLKEMLYGIKVIVADGGYREEIMVFLRSDKTKKNFQPVHKRWII